MLYDFRGKKTVVWFSEKTGRPLVPSTISIRRKIEASSYTEAADQLARKLELETTTSQNRVISFNGIVMEVCNGRILGQKSASYNQSI